MVVSQYEVVLVNLNPTVGSEIRKTRPYVVISPIELNRNLNTIVIAPMTTNLRNYPTRVPVSFDGKEGRIALDQIRSINAKRIVKQLGSITSKEVINLKQVMQKTYVD
jgi:mRNA interferase MazF